MYKTILLLGIATLMFLVANQASGQEKKKIIRIIEVDDKGEKVVKEIAIPEVDKKIRIVSDGKSFSIDSLDKVIKIRMNDVLPWNDSLLHLWVSSDVNDFDFDFPVQFDLLSGSHFMLFGDDSLDKSTRMYYREKNFNDRKDLDKVLEEVENGTFDPRKWEMKEVDKDKMKDLKGKGNFLVLAGKDKEIHGSKGFAFVTARSDGNGKEMQVIVERGKQKIRLESDTASSKGKFKTYTFTTTGDCDKDTEQMVWVSPDDKGKGNARVKIKTIEGKGKHGIVYITSDEECDSTAEGKEMTWTVEAEGDGEDVEKVIVIGGDGSEKHQKIKVKKGDGAEGKKDVMVTVVADDKGKTEVQFTDPNAEEMKMLVKNGFKKPDEKSKVDGLGFMISKKEGKEKYKLILRSDESGKVKLTLTDEKGKTLSKEEFEHKKGKTEHELEYNEFKTGIYFLQAQLNGKAIAKKIQIEKE